MSKPLDLLEFYKKTGAGLPSYDIKNRIDEGYTFKMLCDIAPAWFDKTIIFKQYVKYKTNLGRLLYD